MAYTYCIDPKVNCVFIRHTGDFSPGEGFEVTNKFLEDPHYTHGMNILRDCIQATLPDAHTLDWYQKEGRKTVSKFDSLIGACRLAWVVSSARDFGIVHRWTATTRFNTKVERSLFRDLAKAKDWLGIAEDYEIKYPPND